MSSLPLSLVDSHCHLNYADFKDDLPAVIQRAREHHISHMLTINTRLSEAIEIQEIATAHNFIFCTVGVHPHDAADYAESDLKQQIIDLCQHPKVVGIGETGLDYYYNNSPRDQQIESFNQHLEVATHLDLPLIIHTRDADADTIACIQQHLRARGVFHCFSGDLTLAKSALDLGYYISFSGIITFKKAEELREVVKYVPLSRILVETDAPFLAPIPHRGQRNEPAFTWHTAEMVAELKGESLASVAQQTTDNFFNLFTKAKRI